MSLVNSNHPGLSGDPAIWVFFKLKPPKNTNLPLQYMHNKRIFRFVKLFKLFTSIQIFSKFYKASILLLDFDILHLGALTFDVGNMASDTAKGPFTFEKVFKFRHISDTDNYKLRSFQVQT